MDYRTVGATGVQVSPLCFGTMSFGSEADEEASAAMYRRARELGINFFDTADIYGGGRSEEILGRLAARERDDLVITSKVFFPTGEDPNAGASRAATSCRPSRPDCAASARTGSTSTSSTRSTRAPRSSRRCGRSTTSSSRARSSTRP
ncbi:aldo/keto reductase [Sinomonas atrocyanea]